MTEPIIIPVDAPTTGTNEIERLIQVLRKVAEGYVENIDSQKRLIISNNKVVASNTEVTESLRAQAAAAGILISETGDLDFGRKQDAAATDAQAEAGKRKNAVVKEELTWNDRLMLSQERILAQKADIAVAQEVGNAAYSKTYQNLAKMEGLGTPAILKAATWGALGIGGVAYEAIKTYTHFNKLITQSITQGGRSANSLGFLTDTALQTAKSTGTALNDVANIIYRVSSATAGMNNGLGASNKLIGSMTTQIANLGVLGGIAGGAPTEQSARIMGALINSNLVGVGEDPAKISAFINATVGAGDIKQSELISALGRGLLNTASAKNISASSLGAFVDLLTTKGTPGSSAGNYVKTALSLLTATGTQAGKAMSMIGISSGQINTLLSGPGGITAVAQYLHDQLQMFDPSKFNVKYKGLTGRAGATALLENWGVGNIPQSVINAWGKSGAGGLANMTAAQLGTTQSGAIDKKTGKPTAISGKEWLNAMESSILTKAFGGSRSAATIEALINDPSQVAGIQASIEKNMTSKVYNRDVNTALNTPAQQFSRMKQTLTADLFDIGKALTPWAIKLGKVLVDVAGFFTKFKFLLMPLLSVLGGVIAMAMAAKTAGIMRGAYGLYGGAAMRTNKIWGRIAGEAEGEMGSTRARRFALGAAGSGSKARVTAEIMMKEASHKINQSATKFFDGAVAFTRGVEMSGGMGGGMGGAGKNLSKAEKEAEKLAKAGRELEGIEGLHGRERLLLQNAASEGKVLSKTSIAARLGLGRGKKDKELVESIFNRIHPIQTANKDLIEANRLALRRGVSSAEGSAVRSAEGSAVRSAEGSAVRSAESAAVRKGETAVAEKVVVAGAEKVGGSLLASGIAEGLGGMLGGPIGMMAMTALLPMAMPLIAKGISGMGNLFGKMFGSTAPTAPPPPPTQVGGPTLGATQSKILADQAELTGINKKIARGTATAADYARASTLRSEISSLKSSIPSIKAAVKANATTAGQRTLARNALSESKAVSGMLPSLDYYSNKKIMGIQYLGGWSKLSTATQKKVLNMEATGNNTGTAIATFLRSQQKVNNNWLTDPRNAANVTSVAAHYLSRINTASMTSKQLGGNSRANYLLGTDFGHNLSAPGAAQERYATFARAEIKARTEAKIDLAASKNTSLGSAAQAQLAKTAAELTKQANAFQHAQAEVKRINPNKISSSDIKSMTDAIVSGTKIANNELGLTSSGIAAAMSSAIGPGGIAAIVNTAGKNIRARS